MELHAGWRVDDRVPGDGGLDQCGIGPVPCDVGLDSCVVVLVVQCSFGLDPCDVGLVVPCVIGLDPCGAGRDPCVVGLVPCGVGRGQCSFGLDPCDVGLDQPRGQRLLHYLQQSKPQGPFVFGLIDADEGSPLAYLP